MGLLLYHNWLYNVINLEQTPFSSYFLYFLSDCKDYMLDDMANPVCHLLNDFEQN